MLIVVYLSDMYGSCFFKYQMQNYVVHTAEVIFTYKYYTTERFVHLFWPFIKRIVNLITLCNLV